MIFILDDSLSRSSSRVSAQRVKTVKLQFLLDNPNINSRTYECVPPPSPIPGAIAGSACSDIKVKQPLFMADPEDGATAPAKGIHKALRRTSHEYAVRAARSCSVPFPTGLSEIGNGDTLRRNTYVRSRA